MRKMKDSGVPWIGIIPEEWSLIRFKDKYINRKEIAGSKSPEYQRLALTLGGVIKRPKDDSDGLQPKEFDTYQILRENEFVFKMIDLQNINTSRVGLSPFTGLVSPAYIKFAPRNENQYSKYVYYYLMSMYYNCVFNNLGGDGVRSALNATDMGTLLIPFPPYDEQRIIVDAIEREIKEVEALISNQQKQIEKLKQYKQSIITETILGIKDSGKKKSSGIDWIGNIPENTDIIGIQYILDKTHPYPLGDGDHGLIGPDDYTTHGIPYIRVQNLGWGTKLLTDNIVFISEERNETIKNSTLRPNDILFAKTGATIGKTGIIPDDMPIANTTSHIGKITVSPKYDAKYIFYVLTSYVGYRQFWQIACQKTTRPELAISEMKTIKVLVPNSLDKQRKIAQFLDKECAVIDRLIAIKETKAEKLMQYKKTLVYEYVTGKKEVV